MPNIAACLHARNITIFTFLFTYAATLRAYRCEDIPAYSGKKKASVNLKQLEQFIRSEKITSKPMFLKKLSEHRTYKELLTGTTVLHTSGSAQSASKERPRGLIYGADASLIVSLDGSSTNQSLEVIQYDETNDTVEFKQITLVEASPSPAHSNKGGDPKRHPQRCDSCHGKELAYRWTAYDVWEGAYGAFHDRIRKGSPEHEAYLAFVEKAKEDPIYRYFVNPKGIESVNTPARKTELLLPGGGNGRLGDGLSIINLKRVARRLTQTPDHDKYTFALLGALAGCGDADSFLPEDPDFRKRNHPKPFYEVRDETEKIVKAELPARKKRMATFHGDDNYGISGDELDIGDVSNLRYLLEGRGVDVQAWSMVEGSYSLSGDGFYGTKKLACFYWNLVKDNPKLAFFKSAMEGYSLSSGNSNGGPRADCAKLRALSRSALEPGGAVTETPKDHGDKRDGPKK